MRCFSTFDYDARRRVLSIRTWLLEREATDYVSMSLVIRDGSVDYAGIRALSRRDADLFTCNSLVSRVGQSLSACVAEGCVERLASMLAQLLGVGGEPSCDAEPRDGGLLVSCVVRGGNT